MAAIHYLAKKYKISHYLIKAQFGNISQKEITQTLKDIFGAKPSKRHGNSSRLAFDRSKLSRIGKIYVVSIEVKVTNVSSMQHKEGQEEKRIGEDGYDGEDLGLDKHLVHTLDQEITE